MNNTTETTNNTTAPEQSFDGLGIAEEMMSVLRFFKYTIPTPIQHKAIPVATQGKDVIGIAQTGTGKTLAFGVPMIQRILQAEAGGRGLIILPTRELAAQVNETLVKLGRGFGLRTAVLIGGASMGFQIKSIRNNPHIIIGTPGRVIDHLKQRTLKLDDVGILVLDEADHMFDMGFAPQIKQILQSVPTERQTMLFSATMPDEILKVATTYMKLPLRIEIAPPGTKSETIEHEIFFIQKEQKMTLLKKLLMDYKGSVLVFSRTKHGAKKICAQLMAANFSASEIHSNKSLMQRRQALDGFKSGKYRVLVATDIASRGIDVKGIELVLNYDLPEAASDYVHRIGRTGRAGLTGKAISFVTPEQRNKVRDIERLIKSKIPVTQLPGITLADTAQSFPRSTPNNYRHAPRNFKKPYPSRFKKRY